MQLELLDDKGQATAKVDAPDTLLIAAAACEIHPNAMLRALESERIADALDKASADVEKVPSIFDAI